MPNIKFYHSAIVFHRFSPIDACSNVLEHQYPSTSCSPLLSSTNVKLFTIALALISNYIITVACPSLAITQLSCYTGPQL